MPDFPAVIELAALGASDGVALNSNYYGAGQSVSSIGDINGDGIDDIIVSNMFYSTNSPQSEGRAYIVFGKLGGLGSIDLDNMSASDGFYVSGTPSMVFGESFFLGRDVSGAGDVNGDGLGDIIIAAHTLDYDTGVTYVIYGKSSGLANIDVANLAAGDAIVISGKDGDGAAREVSSAGDVNGDGLDDLIVANRYASNGGTGAGSAYVIYGKAGGGAVDLDTMTTAEGFRIDGGAGVALGISIAPGGDINNDGRDDLVIGTAGAGLKGYVIYGFVGTRGNIDTTAFTAADGAVIQGSLSAVPRAISGAGDVNGDGIDDFVVSAGSNDAGGNNAGGTYVVFGKTGFGDIDLATLAASDGFFIQGADDSDFLGEAVSSAGDVNGDGFDDIIVGAPFRAGGPFNYNQGAAYVIFGKASGFGTIDLGTPLDGDDGFMILGASYGYDYAGYSLSSAGDVNGDGFDDIMVGTRYGLGGASYNEAAYIIYGKAPTTAVNRQGADGDQVIRGGDLNDTLAGLGGADSLVGGEGDDSLEGGAGEDVLHGGAGGDAMAGGADDDTYYVRDAGDTVVEAPGGGDDTVLTKVDFDAGNEEIERIVANTNSGLELKSAGINTELVGAGGNDTLLGTNAGLDTLAGKGGGDRLVMTGGSDLMIGGGGSDTFVLTNQLPDAERATVADFVSGSDSFEIDADSFGGGLVAGPLDPDAFVANATGKAEDAEDRFVYDTTTGKLWFDANGNAAGGRELIAKLTGAPTLVAGDFDIVGGASAPPPMATSQAPLAGGWLTLAGFDLLFL